MYFLYVVINQIFWFVETVSTFTNSITPPPSYEPGILYPEGTLFDDNKIVDLEFTSYGSYNEF
jgi:hypothetical protein